MRTDNFRKVLATIFASFLISITFSQSAHDGDMLRIAIGKASESPEVKSLETAYHCEMVNNTHYLSKEGIELMMQDGALSEIRLYQNSSVYGQFKDNLPHGLKFGMTGNQVRSLLGKPTVNYSSSGYQEYEWQGHVYACGFEGGKLNQLTLSRK